MRELTVTLNKNLAQRIRQLAEIGDVDVETIVDAAAAHGCFTIFLEALRLAKNRAWNDSTLSVKIEREDILQAVGNVAAY